MRCSDIRDVNELGLPRVQVRFDNDMELWVVLWAVFVASLEFPQQSDINDSLCMKCMVRCEEKHYVIIRVRFCKPSLKEVD